MRKASLSNKTLAAWRVWVRLAAIASAAFVLGVLFGPTVVMQLADAINNAGDARRSREALAPLIEQAKLWPMTYETAEPGKVVDWCVDHVASGNSYLAGKPSQPLEWTNESAVPVNGPTSGNRCTRVLARVAQRTPRAVTLTFLGTL